jgi:REP-associated tyrosine transposase
MHTGKPDHLKAFDYLGRHRYSLTFCTHTRAALFITAERVDLVMGQILRSASEQVGEILVYCFMPDHLHLLVVMHSDSSDCLRFISRAKQFSGYHYQQTFGHRLWQRYGFERTLRDDEDMLEVARYILANPVRKGMVERAEAYPFSGSEKHTVKQILDGVQMMRDGRSG